MFHGQMANIVMVELLEILYSTYCYFLYSSMYIDKAYHKNCIVAVILSHTHLSVCSVMLTLRASPKATPPLTPITFPSRLCLIYKIIKFYPLKHIHVLNITTQRQMCTWKSNCYGYCQV